LEPEPEADEGGRANRGGPARRLQPLSIEEVLLEPAPPHDGDRPPSARPTPPGSTRRPAAGPILTAIALGLREVFDPQPKERTQIEQEAPGEPDEPQRYEVHLDPKNPRNSSAVYRPWVEEPGSS
jgi:hypothetical protein